MWDRLRKQVAVEVEQLNRLLEVHRPLLTRCRDTAPDSIELSALGACCTLSTPALRISSSELRSKLAIHYLTGNSGIVNCWTA